MLEPIGLIARLDRLGRASRAQSTRCVYGLSMVPGTSRQAERQFKVSSARAQAQRILWAAARPRGGKGEPAAASRPAGNRPAWQKASIKGRLEGQGGQSGRPSYFQGPRTQIYPFRFTSIRVIAFTEKQEASKPPHTLALKRSCVMVWRRSLRFAQCRDHDGGQSPTRRHAHV